MIFASSGGLWYKMDHPSNQRWISKEPQYHDPTATEKRLMAHHDEIREFYLEHLPGAKIEGNMLKAPCPLCGADRSEKRGTLVAYLDSRSLFAGYFRCLSRCRLGGFPPYFARCMGIDPHTKLACEILGGIPYDEGMWADLG